MALATWLHGGVDAVSSWQFKASKLLAEEVGSAIFRLYKIKADGTWSEIESHPVLDLLYKPNLYSTRSELFEAVSMSLDFFGNAYLFMDGADSPTAKPKALHILKPQNITIVRTDTFPANIVAYKYRYNAREYVFQPHQVLHIRETNPSDPLKGLGPVQAMEDSIELDRNSKRWNSAFFNNSARPDLILKSKFKTREQMDPIRAQFEDKYKGTENAHKVAILPDGVEPEKMGWNQRDMDFVEQLRWTRDDILSGLRTPHVVLGLGAGENLNRATADATNYIYALRTIMPRLRRIASQVNAFLLPRFGKDLVIDFDNVVPEDEDLQVRKRVAALGGAPYQSVNEVREELGLDPVKGGEDVMAPYSQMPLGSSQEPQVQPKAPKHTYIALKAAKEDEAVSLAVSKTVGTIIDKAASAFEAATKAIHKERQETRWRDFVARITPYERLIRKRMTRYGQRVAERAAAQVQTPADAAAPENLLERNKEIGIIIDILTPPLHDLSQSESKIAADEVGAVLDPADTRLHALVDDAISLMAGSYHDTTLSRIKVALEEGIKAGEGMEELRKRIQDIGELASEFRATQVAMTESYRIANMSAKETWKALGVKTIRWYTAKDEQVCEFCGPMEGKIVGVEDNYFDKGDVIQGRDGGVLNIDYSDVGTPPLHPNCRCQTAHGG